MLIIILVYLNYISSMQGPKLDGTHNFMKMVKTNNEEIPEADT